MCEGHVRLKHEMLLPAAPGTFGCINALRILQVGRSLALAQPGRFLVHLTTGTSGTARRCRPSIPPALGS